jgi:hypothetical protein
MDGGVTNSIIQYCYSHDNDGAGYLMWNYEGAPHQLSNNTIRYCISANDGRKHKYGAIHIGTSGLPITNIDVYHNTIYMPAATGASPKGIWTGAWGSKDSNSNLRFFNNIIVTTGEVPLVQIESPEEQVLFAGNEYWNTENKFLIQYKDSSITSLAAWRKIAGQEKTGNQERGHFTDPRLMHPESSETIKDAHQLHRLTSYRLQPHSPVVGTGVNLSLFGIQNKDKDFWGNPVSSQIQISSGAFHLIIR